MENGYEEKEQSGCCARPEGWESAREEADGDGTVGAGAESCSGQVGQAKGRKEKSYVIYTIARPNGKAFYVGKTCNPRARLSQHMSKYGRDIQMKIREHDLDDQKASVLEKEWIRRMASRNRLINQQFVNPPKNKVMLVRLNDEEMELLEHAAADRGITVAAFIRSASLQKSENILGVKPAKKPKAAKKGPK